ncbi:MAG TPA: sugar-binding protein [Prolixibacteraceae bacterium]|nr:sugar-binding protein [Prolixibacteraceae bacterium]
MEYSLTSDSLSLVALFNKMGGAEWANADNWLSGPLAEWYGVTVDGERVARLQLANNNLSGELCNELYNLTALDTLDIQGNDNLSGSIPMEIGLLTDLSFLSLWNCNLSGDLPVTFWDLTNLTFLDLNNNAFTGEIPSDIGDLTLLTQLWLGGNQFSGTIPAEVNNLVNLTHLDFRYLPLDPGAMPNLNNLTQLIHLDLRQCGLTGAISPSLSVLTNLENLYLFLNNFDPAPLPDLSALTHLQRFYAYNCNLSGSLPSWLGSLTALTDLRLQFNQFTGQIPSELSNLGNLVYCLLNDNQLEGSIPASFANLSNLRYLYLHRNILSGDLPELFNSPEGGTVVKEEWIAEPSLYDIKSEVSGESEPGIESMDNLWYLNVYNNLFTFSNLEASDIRPGDITGYRYAPQDTVFAMNYLAAEHALTVLDDKSDNNTYRWLRNGDEIPGESNDTLLLGNLGGNFRCLVTNTVFTDLEIESEEIPVEADPCGSVVVFDPETCNPADLPQGMDIVDVEGTKYVRIALDGWQSFFSIPPYLIPGEVTHFRFEAKFTEGTSGQPTGNVEMFFKFAEANWNEISHQYFPGNGDFAEYRIPVGPDHICRFIQTAARETTGSTVLSGDTIYIGKIRAYIDDPTLVVNPANYDTSDLPEGWEVVCLEGDKYFKAALDGWNSWMFIDACDFPGMTTHVRGMAKYEVGTSGLDIGRINTFIKLSTPGGVEICANGAPSNSELTQYVLSIPDPSQQVGLLQLAGQDTTDWSVVSGDTLYLGALEAYMDLPVLSHVDVQKTNTAPLIDGIIDDVWSDADPILIGLDYNGEAPTVDAYWKAMWADSGIFVLLRVQDDNHWPFWEAGTGNSWDYDGGEIYFDVNTNRKDGRGSRDGQGHYSVGPTFESDLYGVLHSNELSEWVYRLDGENWTSEHFYRFNQFYNDIGEPMSKEAFLALDSIGFDVYILDQDEGITDQRHRKVWQNVGSTDENWAFMDDAGTITLIEPQKPNIDVASTGTPPVIDGLVDNVWNTVTPVPVELPFVGESPSVTAQWRMLWDSENFYVLMEVQDDNHWPAWESGGNVWEYDRAEFYLDLNENITDGLGVRNAGSGHYQQVCDFEDGGYNTEHILFAGEQNAGGTVVYRLDGENYVVEWMLPFANLHDGDSNWMDVERLRNLGTIGFDVTITDQDEGITDRRHRKVWQSDGTIDECWNNMDGCGTITMVGDPPPVRNIEVRRTETAPVIDGVEDAIWADSDTIFITKNFTGENPTVDAFWKAMWADSGLFVLLNVQDDNHYPSWEGGGEVWNFDGAEVYFDVNEDLHDGLGAMHNQGHYQSQPAFADGLYGVKLTGETNNIGNLWGGWYAHQLTGESWVREFFFPFDVFVNKDGLTLDRWEFLSMDEIGFDVSIIDQDEGITDRRHRKVWQNDGLTDESWNNMDDAGTITLVGGYALEKDSLALVAFYNATNGDGWNHKDNWLTGPLHTWWGVTIENGRVTMLDLEWDNNLTGQLPDELGNLTRLTRLYLPANWNLGGPIPASIGNLKQLQFLDLENCALTGTLPDEILGLTSLTHLIVGGNSFDPAPMPDFSPLVNLTALSINNCQLTGSINEGFTQLNNLTMVNLSWNDFSPGPIPDFHTMNALVNVYMSGSHRNGTLPGWLTSMNTINELALNDNEFTGPLPSDLNNMTELRLLDLGNNGFEAGPVPDMSALVNLSSLWIGNTNRTGTIPAWLGTLTNLQWLNLASNQLNGAVPDNLGNLTQLLGLYLNNNQLSGTLPASLGNLTEIWDLIVNNNNFSGSIPAEICNYLSIGNLNLSNNQLTGEIPALIGNLDDLWYLDLSSNQLTGTIPAGIGSMAGLSTLRLNNNQLEGSIPVEFGNLTNLGECLLNNNRLSGPLPGSISEAMAPDAKLAATETKAASYSKDSYAALTAPLNERLKTQPEEVQPDAMTNLGTLHIQNNRFTFADLEASGIEPGEIGDFVYAPQDTTLGLELIEGAGTNSLTVLDGKATNNTYQWYYNIEAMAGETNDTIAAVEPLGAYYCKVQNTTYTGMELISEQYGIMDYDLSTDSLALVALYNATGGAGWMNQENWLTGPVNTWLGVTVEDDRVTRLELTNNNLNGSLPLELCYLTGLTQLNLSDHPDLTGTIPSSIDNLTLLEDLSIANTHISGTIPSSLSNLANLTALNLGWNDFSSGTLPDLSRAVNLWGLWVGNCRLSGEIPAWLLNMAGLRNLAIDNNDFTPGPMPDFSGLTQINDLNIYNCNFTGAIPASLLGMNQILWLNIGENNFDPAPMPDFSGMPDLQALNIRNCNLTGEIPASVGLLTDLWSLDLAQNQLSGSIPVELGNLVNMNTLNLDNNELNGSLPAGFGDMAQLRELRLNNNQLGGAIPNGLGNSANLFVLTLENNQFQHANLEPIWGWTNFAGITEFVYAPQGEIGSESTVFTSEGYAVTLAIDSYAPSVNDEYQWYKNNELIPGANGQTLVFESPVPADAGEYNCVVTNTVTTTLTLTSLPITLHVGSVGLVGTFNEWGGSTDEPFVQDDEDPDLWSLVFTLTNNGDVKFRWNNDWTINWGDNAFPAGIAVQDGANIPAAEGHYLIDFNIATGEYSFEYIDSLALVALYDSTGGASWNNHDNWLTGPLATWNGVTVENGRVVGLNLGWDNNLNGELPDQIGDLSAIKWFIASGNDGLTGNIPATIGNWASLQTLGFYNCSITGTIPAEALTLNRLEQIDLSWNNFDAAPMPDFGLLPNLHTLTIEACNFTGPIPAGLSGLTQLTTLYLSENLNLDAGGIPDLSAATNLRVLGMNNCNRTGTIPAWLTQMASLQRVLLGGNSLTGAIPSNFIAPGNIVEYIVNFNNIDAAPMPDLSLLVNLEILGMAGCNLTGEIPAWLTTLTDLTDLNLSFNQLEGNLPANIGDLNALVHLNVEENELTGQIPASFANLSHLRWGYLNHNGFLADIPDLSGLAELETLQTGSNRFTFANLATSGLEPGDIHTLMYAPQDTLLALERNENTLTVLDGAHPLNRYVWYRDDIQLPDTTRSIEIVENGSYRAIVENWIYIDLTLYSDTLEVELPVVPENEQVSNYSLSDGNSDCINALNTIIVAGDETSVDFLSGSSVTLIAGYSIRFLPGFHAHNGSYMDAHITTTGSFCDDLPAAMMVESAPSETVKAESLYDEEPETESIAGTQPFMKVYPNPTTGRVRVEWAHMEGPVQITLFNSLGAKLAQESVPCDTFIYLNLTNNKKGVYFVNIRGNNAQQVQKVVLY